MAVCALFIASLAGSRATVFASLPASFTLSVSLPEGTVPASIAVEAIDLSGSVSHVVVPVEFETVVPEITDTDWDDVRMGTAGA